MLVFHAIESYAVVPTARFSFHDQNELQAVFSILTASWSSWHARELGSKL